MFDVDFSEIVVVLVVALIVIGPERMPKVARTMGNMWGRVQRFVNQVKRDVNQSVELADLRELESKAKAEVDALARTVQQAGNDLDHEVRQLENELVRTARHAGSDAQPSISPLPTGRI